MHPQDARKLPPDALEALRRRAIAAVESGASRAEVARMLGVSRQTISTWHREYRARGEEALQSRRRGRRQGEQLALSYAQQLWTIRTVTTRGPEQAGLRYWLWTNQALAELVNNRFGIALSVTTVRNYLIRWGVLTESVLSNRLGDRRVEQLARSAATAPVGGETWWIDRSPTHQRTGPRLDAAGTEVGTEVGGQEVGGQEVAVLYAVSTQGTVLFLSTVDPFDGSQVAEFFTRLLRQRNRPLTIVPGWRPTRGAEAVTAWTARHADRVSVRFAVEEPVNGPVLLEKLSLPVPPHVGTS
ncbi:helix-turn-helix domain-containing protein [Saccharothrix stipae]